MYLFEAINMIKFYINESTLKVLKITVITISQKMHLKTFKHFTGRFNIKRAVKIYTNLLELLVFKF